MSEIVNKYHQRVNDANRIEWNKEIPVDSQK